MSITKKTILFISSLFSSIIFLSALSIVVSPFALGLSSNIIANIIYPLMLTLVLFFFITFQALLRYLMNKKALSGNTALFSISINKFGIKEKLWVYLFIILIYFVPLLNELTLDYTFAIRIIMFILTFLLVEVLLRFSYKGTKIHFLKNGIIISGFDIRIDIPFGQNILIHNDSGIYKYYDIDSYFISPDQVELFLRNEQGKINFKVDEEAKRQVMGIMAQQEIKMKKFS